MGGEDGETQRCAGRAFGGGGKANPSIHPSNLGVEADGGRIDRGEPARLLCEGGCNCPTRHIANTCLRRSNVNWMSVGRTDARRKVRWSGMTGPAGEGCLAPCLVTQVTWPLGRPAPAAQRCPVGPDPSSRPQTPCPAFPGPGSASAGYAFLLRTT